MIAVDLRRGPSANVVLVDDVLVDAGSGSPASIDEGVAITGDLLQSGDVAWVPFAGPWAEGALERTIAAVRRIAALDPVQTIPGHGPVVTDVPAAVAANLERYARFREGSVASGLARRAARDRLAPDDRAALRGGAGDAGVGPARRRRGRVVPARTGRAGARRPRRARRRVA